MKIYRILPVMIILGILVLLVNWMFLSPPKIWRELHSISADNFIFNLNSIEKKLSTFTKEDISEFKEWRPYGKIEEEYLYLFIWKTLFFENGDTSFPESVKLSESGKDVLMLWIHPSAEANITRFLSKIPIEKGSEPFDLNVIRLLVSLPDKYYVHVLNNLKKHVDPENSVFNATGIYGEEMLEVIRYISLKQHDVPNPDCHATMNNSYAPYA
jgi:hypothetical protein